MCKALGVSRSGFYKWKAKPVSKRLEKKKLVEQEVLDTYSTFKARYGAPRIAKELNEAGVSCSPNHVASLLAANGLKARNGKAFNKCR